MSKSKIIIIGIFFGFIILPLFGESKFHRNNIKLIKNKMYSTAENDSSYKILCPKDSFMAGYLLAYYTPDIIEGDVFPAMNTSVDYVANANGNCVVYAFLCKEIPNEISPVFDPTYRVEFYYYVCDVKDVEPLITKTITLSQFMKSHKFCISKSDTDDGKTSNTSSQFYTTEGVDKLTWENKRWYSTYVFPFCCNTEEMLELKKEVKTKTNYEK